MMRPCLAEDGTGVGGVRSLQWRLRVNFSGALPSTMTCDDITYTNIIPRGESKFCKGVMSSLSASRNNDIALTSRTSLRAPHHHIISCHIISSTTSHASSTSSTHHHHHHTRKSTNASYFLCSSSDAIGADEDITSSPSG